MATNTSFTRLYPIGLLVSFLICYLEWGKMKEFAFEMEYQMLAGLPDNLLTFANPLVLTPFACQLLLLLTAFQKVPNRKIILGATLLLLPFVLIVAIGGISGTWKMTLSALPFLIIASVFFFHYKKLGNTRDRIHRILK